MTALFENIDKDLLKKFKEYHIKNPQVYEAFKKYVGVLKNAGRSKYSAQAIIHRIRWDYDVKTTGDVFKINNDYSALYGRLYIHNHPKDESFFSLREMKAVRRKISKEQRERENDS